MQDRNPSDVRATLDDAARAQRQARVASRWFPWYLLLLGASAFALIVAIEALFPSGTGRVAAAAAWALVVVLLSRWAESHDVVPRGAGRRLLIATAVWFGVYLVVIGPLVRWQAGESLGWWSLAAAVLTSPFLVGAWRERGRS